MMSPIGSSQRRATSDERPATNSRLRAGFTLIEVLVAIVILASGAVFVSQALVQLAHTLAAARDQAVVYDFAATKLAEVSQAFRYHPPKDNDEAGSFQRGARWYHWHVSAAPAAEDHPERLLVELTVSWDAEGQAQVRRYAQHVTMPKERETP